MHLHLDGMGLPWELNGNPMDGEATTEAEYCGVYTVVYHDAPPSKHNRHEDHKAYGTDGKREVRR